MRLRTVAVVVGLLGLLGGLVVYGLVIAPSSGTLTEAWVSDIPRENTVNHHAVGVGPEGDVIVAPVAEVPHSDVKITNTSCALVRLAPENGSVRWRAGMPADDCFTHALTEPAIEDIDGDGTLEAVVATTENALVAHDTQTGAEEWRVSQPTYGYGRPTVANVTAAPGPEVVTSDIGGNVLVTQGDGTVEWRFDLNETVWASPSVWDAPIVDDIDGDGQPEVLLGSGDGIALLSAAGDIEWLANGSATYLATANVDDDAAVEVFTAATQTIRAYDGQSANLEWNRSITNGRIRVAADGDGDGSVELYIGRIGGDVLALDATSGETEWSTSISTSGKTIVPPPVLGDVDGDDDDDVIAVTNDGGVAVLKADSGSELGRYERTVPIWTFPTPADIDSDGRAEILVRYADGRVVALDYDS